MECELLVAVSPTLFDTCYLANEGVALTAKYPNKTKKTLNKTKRPPKESFKHRWLRG